MYINPVYYDNWNTASVDAPQLEAHQKDTHKKGTKRTHTGTYNIERDESPEASDDEQDTTHRATKRPKKLQATEDLQYLHGLIHRYHLMTPQEVPTLINDPHTSQDNRKILYEIYSKPSYNSTLHKAFALEKEIASKTDFMTVLHNYTVAHQQDHNGTHKYLSSEKSLQIFEEWCTQQGIHMRDLVQMFKDILTKQKPKINTLMFQGQPNAGKSFIIRSLLPIARFYAEINPGMTGNNFMFQEAPDSCLIIMEEPHIDSATAEKLKLIMEGADTFVPVKNTSDKMIKRTPFFITSNNDLWKWCTQNKAAFEARMYCLQVSPIPMLQNIHKKLNPLMWADLFQQLETSEDLLSLELSEDCHKVIS